MAEKIIKNPSITSGDFSFSGDAITAIVGHPIAGAGGGGTQSDYVYVPSFDDQTGDITFTLDTTASEGKGPWHISGAQGPQGPSGINGTDGKDGDNGFSPTVSTATTATEDKTGTVLTFTYGDEGGQTVSYTAWNGKDGTGATVNLLEGDGIQITQAGTTYTIGVSADYLKSVSVAANGSLAGSGTNSNPLSLKTSAENALAAVDGKVNKPATSLVDKYLVLRTDSNGDVSGWCDFQDQSYSKSEADGRYVATANIDSTTLSGNGKSSSTKLGVNTEVIPTKDWLDDNYLPLSGGTVSGQLTISGDSFNNNLHLKRGNNEGFIGLASNGAITIKNATPNSTSQIEFLTSANKTFDITVKDNSSTPQPVGKLYAMSAHSLADATATSANWANDGMLHIILES